MRTHNLLRTLAVTLGLIAFSASSYAHWDVGISVGFAPPLLPVYVQPPIPGEGYIWTPGYWAYDNDDGYYWVPGTWVLAPRPGFLWTPAYWGADGAYFAFHPGYWGPTVGFYGGIAYGFGYFGVGFSGGYWRDNGFCYNRAVTNITNVSITNVYNSPVANNHLTGSRVSYNGGPDGTRLRPSGAEEAAARAPHLGATDEQRRHESAARSTPSLRAAANHGVPPVAATSRPATFGGAGLTSAHGAVASERGDARGAAQARPDVSANHATSGRQSLAPATASVRSGSPQPGQLANASRTDRPSWATRGTTPSASGRPATALAAQRVQTATGRDARTPASGFAGSSAYQSARPSATRSPPPTRSPATYQSAAHQPTRPAYAQRATTAPRESARGSPSYGAARPTGNPASARTYSAPRATQQQSGDARARRR